MRRLMRFMNVKDLDELARRLGAALPSGLGALKQDMDKNVHAALRATLAKMDLVTREEFEVQRGVLARTRAKLEALEKQVAELERQLGITPSDK